MRLEGKRALVTGAQQGIGRAAVLALAREGADVAINWFEGQPAAEQLAEEVRALGRRALTVQGDVSKSADDPLRRRNPSGTGWCRHPHQ